MILRLLYLDVADMIGQPAKPEDVVAFSTRTTS